MHLTSVGEIFADLNFDDNVRMADVAGDASSSCPSDDDDTNKEAVDVWTPVRGGGGGVGGFIIFVFVRLDLCLILYAG